MLLKYVILIAALIAQNYTTVLGNLVSDPPLDIFYKATEEKEFDKACIPLKNSFPKLSRLVTELVKKEILVEPKPIAVAREPGLSDSALNLFFVVVYEIGYKKGYTIGNEIGYDHVTMAVLLTRDNISVLDYYLGFDIGGIIIHKILSKAMKNITTERDPDQQKKTYHSWLYGLVFQGYQAATEKWEHVRYKPIGMDVGIRDAYIQVRNDCAAAADVLAQTNKYKGLLKDLAGAIRRDFADADETKSLEDNKLKNVVNPAFTILQYMKQEVDAIVDGKKVKATHTGFILQIKKPYERVLGVTIYNGKIFTEFSLLGNQQRSSNPYNVFLLKCQTLAPFFRKNPQHLKKISAQEMKKGLLEDRIFGELPFFQSCPLAKFGLTYTPWKTSIAWTGFKCGFFNESDTAVDDEIGSEPTQLTEMEKKFVYSRCNSIYADLTWSDITKPSQTIDPPKPSQQAMDKSPRVQTTWVEKQNEFLDELVNGIARRKTAEWIGVQIVDWVEKLPKEYPSGELYVTPDPALFFSGPNPVVDIIINISVKDSRGIYVLTKGGDLRWNTVTGRRGRPPWSRQLHGGYVEINKEIEEILGWIMVAYGPRIRKILFDDICLLNALKEFLEESKGILSLPVDEKKAMWLKFVRLIFVENEGQKKVKYLKIFEGPNGDQRNQKHSYGYGIAYAFFVIYSPELEAFLDEKELIGGDDNVESAIVTLSNGMSCFATHELFFLRSLRHCPRTKDVIESLKDISESDTSVILKKNMTMLLALPRSAV